MDIRGCYRLAFVCLLLLGGSTLVLGEKLPVVEYFTSTLELTHFAVLSRLPVFPTQKDSSTCSPGQDEDQRHCKAKHQAIKPILIDGDPGKPIFRYIGSHICIGHNQTTFNDSSQDYYTWRFNRKPNVTMVIPTGWCMKEVRLTYIVHACLGYKVDRPDCHISLVHEDNTTQEPKPVYTSREKVPSQFREIEKIVLDRCYHAREVTLMLRQAISDSTLMLSEVELFNDEVEGSAETTDIPKTTATEAKESSENSFGAIVTAILMTVILLTTSIMVAIALVWYFYRKRKAKRTKASTTIGEIIRIPDPALDRDYDYPENVYTPALGIPPVPETVTPMVPNPAYNSLDIRTPTNYIEPVPTNGSHYEYIGDGLYKEAQRYCYAKPGLSHTYELDGEDESVVCRTANGYAVPQIIAQDTTSKEGKEYSCGYVINDINDVCSWQGEIHQTEQQVEGLPSTDNLSQNNLDIRSCQDKRNSQNSCHSYI